jgi:putative PEP-CTERM system TPR-repeat lipoprotein
MSNSTRRPSTPVIAVALLAALAVSCGKNRDQYLAAGKKYADAKQYREAVVEFRNAIQLDPKSGEAHFRLANAYMDLQDLDNALQEYVKAAAVEPANVTNQLKAANMLLLARRFEDARVYAEKALAREPTNVLAQLVHANALAGLKQFDAAMAEIQKAIELDPTRSESYTDLGRVQVISGSPEKAEENFKEAIEVDPKSPDAYISLATFYWSQDRIKEAEATMKKAVEVDPKNIGANRAMAVFYAGNGREAEAEQYLRTIATTTPTVSARLALADYYIALNRAGDAMPVLEATAKDRDGYGEARSRIAAIQYAAGRTAEAHKTIDETLAADPSQPRALLTKGQFLLVEKKIDDAIKLVKAAVISDPRSVTARSTLGSIYASRHEYDEATQEFTEVLKLNPRSIMAKLELAQLNLNRGLPAVAVDYAQQAVSAKPDNLGLRVLLVRTLVGKGELDRAELELRPLLAQFDKVSELHWLAGSIHLQRKEVAAARQSFERALALNPDAVEPLDALVTLDLRAGDIGHARGLIEQRLAKRPKDSALLVLMSRVHTFAREPEKAEGVLRRAIEVDASNRQPYELLGQLYLSQQKLDGALAEFEEITRRDPKSVSSYTMIGMIHQSRRNSADAQKSYQKALDVNPNAVVAANNLAWIYANQGGNLDVALQLAQVAKAQLPDQPDINDTLGWVYLKKDLPQLAIPPFRVSVEKDPKNPTYQYHLGLAYSKSGDDARARVALRTAVALKPDFAGADDARKLLAAMGR